MVLHFFGRICTFSPVTGFTTVDTPPLLPLPDIPSLEFEPGSSEDNFRLLSSCACFAILAMLFNAFAEGARVGRPAVALFVPFALEVPLPLPLPPPPLVEVVVGVLGDAVAVVLDKRLARPFAPPFRNLLCTCDEDTKRLICEKVRIKLVLQFLLPNFWSL